MGPAAVRSGRGGCQIAQQPLPLHPVLAGALPELEPLPPAPAPQPALPRAAHLLLAELVHPQPGLRESRRRQGRRCGGLVLQPAAPLLQLFPQLPPEPFLERLQFLQAAAGPEQQTDQDGDRAAQGGVEGPVEHVVPVEEHVPGNHQEHHAHHAGGAEGALPAQHPQHRHHQQQRHQHADPARQDRVHQEGDQAAGDRAEDAGRRRRRGLVVVVVHHHHHRHQGVPDEFDPLGPHGCRSRDRGRDPSFRLLRSSWDDTGKGRRAARGRQGQPMAVLRRARGSDPPPGSAARRPPPGRIPGRWRPPPAGARWHPSS